jgi:allantoate deiminase
VVARVSRSAHDIAARRGLTVSWDLRLDQPAVGMDDRLTAMLARSVTHCELPLHHLSSGAGHDAMILAERMPVAMLFLRSPGGISHHPDETVLEEDVAAALAVGRQFLDELARSA